MNHNTKRNNIIRRVLCTVLVTAVMAGIMYDTGIMISASGANNKTETSQEINNEDADAARTNSVEDLIDLSYLMMPHSILLTNYESDDNVYINESLTEETKEVTEIDIPIVMSSALETLIETEVIISEEEKWKSITYASESYTMYCNVTTSYLNIRSSATTGIDNIVGGLYYADEVTVIGYNTYDPMWSVIEYKGNECFVYNEYLSEEVDKSLKISSYENPKWDGVTKLNSVNGRIQGPSGTETYYNLPMDKVVYYMNQLGYYYEVWVRDDGCKMFGDYIMIAANLDIRPKGTLVETSLGMGIVVDTGEFVNYDSTGIDIAVTW